jgi:hypothetical protein
VVQTFVPGLELSRYFYTEAVAPLFAKHYPDLIHSAGRLDGGSDVLGFDTERSTDHGWGPRVTVFLREQDYADDLRDEITRMLGNELPLSVLGYPTHVRVENVVTGSVSMATPGVRVERPLNHMCYVGTTRQFLHRYLGVDSLVQRPPTATEWLALPEQHLRTIRCGGVWHDGTGELARLREMLHWYPDQIWRYVLRAQWRRIEQEEAFAGRAAEVGDELGSRVVAARLVREVVHLAFLIEREYLPYSKWLGTGFSRLRCAVELEPALLRALAATAWPEREAALTEAYEIVARRFNDLGLCETVAATVSPFHGRPFQVIHGDRFAAALETTITDDQVKDLPRFLGNTSQWVDCTDVLSYARWTAPLAGVYGARRGRRGGTLRR